MTERRSFGLTRRSVAASRGFVDRALADLPDDRRESAVLMMSELATNAIVHAGTGFEVTIDRSPAELRVAVTDVGGGEPQVQTPSSSEPHGRGLQIVTRLADDWGMSDNPDRSGKTVWYVLRLDATARRDGSAPTRDDLPLQAAADSVGHTHGQPDDDGRTAARPEPGSSAPRARARGRRHRTLVAR